MILSKLIEGVQILQTQGDLDIDIQNIMIDNANKLPNSIYFCYQGVNADGHNYFQEAISNGAVALIVERFLPTNITQIKVNNVRQIISIICSNFYDNPQTKLKIIGVTGTNGKTSVCYMLLSIFEAAGYKCGLIGTVETLSCKRRRITASGMTTPDPKTLYETLATMQEDGAEYVFMEVSSHALAQCRTDAITFDAAIFTNLTEDHLDFHKNMEEYYKAKEKLFMQARRAFVNVDDAAGRRLVLSLKRNDKKIFTCSKKQGDFYALLGENVENKTEYLLKCNKGEYRVSLPLLGNFQVMNSLEAAALAIDNGILPREVCDALKNMPPVPGRMQEIQISEEQDVKVFIDYAHTPDALEKLIKSAREIKREDGRIITLFGCGGEREHEKRKTMGAIASRLSDIVIVTSDNSRRENTDEIICEILKGIDKEKEYAAIKDRRIAIERAICYFAKSKDIILLAGKGNEKYQIDANGVHEFDEKEIAEDSLKKRFRQRTV